MLREFRAPSYDAAYQGRPGAFSEEAAFKLLSPDARLLPCRSLEDVFSAVSDGTARYGVVPAENTLAGVIGKTYELVTHHDVRIVSETVWHIEQALIAAPGVSFEHLRKVLSHPIALTQCGDFLSQHPEIEPVSAYDTAGAVEMVVQQNLPDAAAIANRRAADIYGGIVLVDNIQDDEQNFTRFLLIANREPRRASAQSSSS